MIERKRWTHLVKPGEWFHLARIRFLPGRLSQLHTHDFPEIFWIEEGRGVHQINEQEKTLYPGDLIFVRPTDRHVLRPADEQGFTLVNLAFSARLLNELQQRYPELAALHASRPSLPFRRQLSAVQTQQLKEDVRRLTATPRQRMPLERFLLGLYLMALPAENRPAPALPDWLEHACTAMERPEHFVNGVAAFVKLSGRSAEYLARTCRLRMGTSPTEFVNRIRMDHAARELRLGSKPIVEVSLECGCNNLAHFYALFRAAHGQTPRRYRMAYQQTIV